MQVIKDFSIFVIRNFVYEEKFRCDCPITSAIDTIGDKWTLVIINQMLLQGKETFKDFTDSTEGITTNILTLRMKKLVELNLVSKINLNYKHE